VFNLRNSIRFCAALTAILLAGGLRGATPDEAVLGRLAEPGHFGLMRHALAPGTGDPAAFSLEDCATQRNLSAAGRDQARMIGERLREAGLVDAAVWTSQWCRCRETGRLLGLGTVRDLPALNSFFRRADERRGRMEALRNWLQEAPLESPTILVTHQVNITALTGVFPRSGEMLVMRRDREGNLIVLGSVETDW